MERYDYTKTPVNIDSLTIEIEAESSITIELDHVNVSGSDLNIYFASSLSSEEKTALDGIVSDHSADVPSNLTATTWDAFTSTVLGMMKELYNNDTLPNYDENFQQFIGAGGRELEHIGRTVNLENIHAKNGWHRLETRELGFQKPANLLIYYGWLNSFNYGTNAWTNEKIAQEMAKYGMIVLGDGIQDSEHGDYANTQIIIPRIKALNPNVKIFGYVTTYQTYANFQTKASQWDALQVHGIFMDESGYDYGSVGTNGRDAFNEKVDYVHGKTYANKAFVNAWNVDHIIGIENDASYPNTTWNSDVLASTMNENDWYLLESFPVNTTAFSANSGYESKSDWSYRGVKAQNHRYTYGINLASVGVINNDNENGQDLFDFHYISSCMFALEAVGTSDTSYGSSSATVALWTRPDISEMGRVYAPTTSVQVDQIDSDICRRYTDFGNFMLDFSDSAQDSLISKY